MESRHCHHSALPLAAAIVQELLEGAFLAVRNNRLNHIVCHEMPEDYLNYIGNVSILLHRHREPKNTRVLGKTITEPAEADSNQLHFPSPCRRIVHPLPPNEQTPSISSKPLIRKQSSCLSHRSRLSIDRMPSRKNIHSRRKIIDNQRLVALNRATEWEQNEKYEQKITQLRKRKVKLEQAMRAFGDEDRSEKPIGKKAKENIAQYTTDFKGKIVNFNPRTAKAKGNQSMPFLIKFSTLVESGRSWNNCGKVSSNTRRNLFARELTNDRGVSEAELC